MEMKLGTHVHYIISMTTTCFSMTTSFRHFSSNLLTVALMEVKLGHNAYDIISMTTKYDLNNKKIASGIYFFTPQTC